MGLLSFVKSVGQKIFGASEAQAAPADELKKEAAKYGLDVSKVDVHVDGDKVKVSGAAMSTEEAEKIILAMGNTLGVSQIDNQLQVQKEAPTAHFYTVKKGDTLWAIAERHFGKGHGARYTEIVEANSPPVKNPDLIQPGWVLRLPPKG
ncbi:MAG: peptidoglycan-binding protein LysM [Caulobacteraceae bacterium]